MRHLDCFEYCRWSTRRWNRGDDISQRGWDEPSEVDFDNAVVEGFRIYRVKLASKGKR